MKNFWFGAIVIIAILFCAYLGARAGWGLWQLGALCPLTSEIVAESIGWGVLVRFGSNVQPGVDLLLQIPTGQRYWTSGGNWHFISDLVGVKIRESESDWLIESIGWDCELHRVTVYVKPIDELLCPTCEPTRECPPPLPIETCVPCATTTPSIVWATPTLTCVTESPTEGTMPTQTGTPEPTGTPPGDSIVPFVRYRITEELRDSYDRQDAIGDWCDVFDDRIIIVAGNDDLGAQLTPIVIVTIRFQDGNKKDFRACRFANGDVVESLETGIVWILRGYTGGITPGGY